MSREEAPQALRGGCWLETSTDVRGFFATALHDDSADAEPYRLFEWIASDRVQLRSYQSAEALLERMELYAPLEGWRVSS